MLLDVTTVDSADEDTAEDAAVALGPGGVEATDAALEGSVSGMDLPSARIAYQRLTDRERTVVRLVGQGYSAPEIGVRLGISPKTVDTYKQRIQEKLHFTHRTQYVQFALKLGLLTED